MLSLGRGVKVRVRSSWKWQHRERTWGKANIWSRRGRISEESRGWKDCEVRREYVHRNCGKIQQWWINKSATFNSATFNRCRMQQILQHFMCHKGRDILSNKFLQPNLFTYSCTAVTHCTHRALSQVLAGLLLVGSTSGISGSWIASCLWLFLRNAVTGLSCSLRFLSSYHNAVWTMWVLCCYIHQNGRCVIKCTHSLGETQSVTNEVSIALYLAILDS